MQKNNFYQTVYAITATIPSGKVATYGQIALLAGRPGCARLVGHAMTSAPNELHIPCHRVVNTKGCLAPEAVFGPNRQRHLLEKEGVPFFKSGRIDMKRALWHP